MSNTETFDILWRNEIVGTLEQAKPEMNYFEARFVPAETSTTSAFLQSINSLDSQAVMSDPTLGVRAAIVGKGQSGEKIVIIILSYSEGRLFLRRIFNEDAAAWTIKNVPEEMEYNGYSGFDILLFSISSAVPLPLSFIFLNTDLSLVFILIGSILGSILSIFSLISSYKTYRFIKSFSLGQRICFHLGAGISITTVLLHLIFYILVTVLLTNLPLH